MAANADWWLVVAHARGAVVSMGHCLQRIVAGATQSLDGADGTRLVCVCIVALVDLDDVASVAHFCVIAIWSIRIEIDNSRVEIVDNCGVKVDVDID